MSSDFSKPQIIPHLEKNVDFTLFSCCWVPCSTRFVVTGSKLDGRGTIQVYSMGSKEITHLSETTTDKAIKCCTFSASSLEDRHLATGDFNGNLAVWDLENISAPIFTSKAHGDLINGIDGAGGLGIGKGPQEIATASRDGTVKVWDIRVHDRPVACIEPEQDVMKRDAWAVAFGNCNHDTGRNLVTGYDNGDVKMFDLRSMSVFWETELDQGVCSLQFDRQDIEKNKLLATCLEGNLYVWDLSTYNPKCGGFAKLCQVHDKATLWTGQHLPQNRDVFMTGGGNSELCLWQYKYPDQRSKKGDNGLEGVPGHLVKLQDAHLGDQPISCFSWSPDKSGLGVCTSFDQKIRTVIVTKLNRI